MTNKDKMEIAAKIIMSILANSAKDVNDRLNAVPEALEKIYNKISELDNNDNFESGAY